ncbi:unnamed protein product [Rhizoctonia solani]|uniref:Uncharacterized protein n=1 Tax=Rhizoctonia solani TaxID=456999 RepID=A0A8H3DIM0_9AGAM|nr:unnamed protein product [Rhizoctonia solani]CAE6525218.1 unnamed protein product [Rhizoctonia solani]
MDQAPDFVRTPLESLSPISVSEMLLNNVHQGKYLIVRAITRTVRLVAIQVAVEDLGGNVVDLALYNCLEISGLDREGICNLIPMDQVLLIREPHPLLEEYPETWKLGSEKDAQAYKDMGNYAFKNDRFESAIHAYSNGLSVDPTASLLRLNRSLCYLKVNKPSIALNDARVASKDETMTDTLRSKARYRMALAYYTLDRFVDALAILENKSQIRFSPKDFDELEKKSRQRLIEQEQGNYDWFSLSKIADEINGSRQILDVADFVGPVKVTQMRAVGGGRGLVTTRDVLAGELLVSL